MKRIPDTVTATALSSIYDNMSENRTGSTLIRREINNGDMVYQWRKLTAHY